MAGRKRKESPQKIVTMQEYVESFCDLPSSRKEVTGLSSLLAHAIGREIREALPDADLVVGHRYFGGEIRRHHLDNFVANEHYGLQMGIDVKGLNNASSVRKNWNNRVGDFHELATNHHGHAPKAVLGGVLCVPFEGVPASVLKNLEKSMANLTGRRVVANAHNLLEVAALIVISKKDRKILTEIPDPNGPLRVEKFATALADVFNSRWT